MITTSAALICMQKNEGILLRAWVDYHQPIFGAENIYIIDNDSTDSLTKEILYEAIQIGCNVIQARKPGDFARKGVIVTSLIRDLSARYDIFCPLDCDEFLYVHADDGISNKVEQIDAEFRRFLASHQPLARISNSLINIPGKPYAYHLDNIKKTLVRTGSRISLDVGYHLYDWSVAASTVSESLFFATKIAHLHLHNKPFPELMRSSTQKLSGRISDFSEASLREYRGAGSHLVKYFFMSEQEYLNSFNDSDANYDFSMLFDGRKIPYLGDSVN